MQNTVQFERSNPLQQLVGLARAMALPHEYAPTRFPSFPALERTALMGFNVPTTVTVPSTGMRALLCRQAAYPLWVDYHSASTPWVYTINLNSEVLQRMAPGGEYSLLTGITSFTNGPKTATSSQTGLTGFSNTMCTYPILAMDYSTGPYPWFYAPTGSSIMVVLAMVLGGTALASDPGVKISYQKWVAPGEILEGIGDFGLGWAAGLQCLNTIVPVTSGGWFRLTKLTQGNTTPVMSTNDYVIQISVSNSTVTAASAGTSTTFPAFTAGTPVPALQPITNPPEITNSNLPYLSTRTTAAAVLFTNVTKVLNKEGTVMCGRLNPTTINVWNFSSGDLVNLHPAEKQLLGLETGAYTFCPPSTDLTNFWDYTLPGPILCPVQRLDNDALVNCMYFADPDGGTNLAVNLDWHIEFRTTSALWQIALSTIPIEVLHQAQLSLVSAGFFFQNETHKSALARILPSIRSTASKLLPMVADLHPAAKLAYKAYRAISSQPKSGPQPTTLMKSSKSDGNAKRQNKKEKQVKVARTPKKNAKSAKS